MDKFKEYTDKDFKEIQSLSFLYKFINFDSGVKTLQNSSLKMTNPIEFNDPLDCNIDLLKVSESFKKSYFYDYELPRIWTEFFKKGRALKPEKIKELEIRYFDNVEKTYNEQEHVKQFIKGYRITCFSKFGDNTLMWAHYSENHKGICLVFDTKILWSAMFSFSKKQGVSGAFYVVKYKPSLKVRYVDKGKNPLPEIKWMSTKEDKWEYEKEVRWTLWNNDHDIQYFKFPPECLVSVYLGSKMNDDNVKVISDLIVKNFPKTSLFKMRLIASAGKYVPEEIIDIK